MGEWTYSSAGPYFRRFVAGEAIAYEGALNNIPIVSAGNMSWDHVIEFKNDPEAARKYRDLRLWLRSGLNAQSVEHATDIIAQKIEDYRWAIKKHGLQTYSGMITQLFDWKDSRLTLVAAGTAGVFGGPIWASLASGLAIAAKIGVLLTEKRISSTKRFVADPNGKSRFFTISEEFLRNITLARTLQRPSSPVIGEICQRKIKGTSRREGKAKDGPGACTASGRERVGSVWLDGAATGHNREEEAVKVAIAQRLRRERGATLSGSLPICTSEPGRT